MIPLELSFVLTLFSLKNQYYMLKYDMLVCLFQLVIASPRAVRITANGTVYEEPLEKETRDQNQEDKPSAQIAEKQTISLELQDADIHSVIRLFADATGRNFVVDDSVQGKVTVFLKDVPWDEALQAILLSKGLIMVPIGEPVQSSSPLLIRPI